MVCMCRSIKVLRDSARVVSQEEISAAALQYVRKVSGFHKPSKVNEPAFDSAVREVATATDRLLRSLALSPKQNRAREQVDSLSQV
jgi:hypothetical protein